MSNSKPSGVRTVTTETDPETGTVTRQAWYKDDQLDRADGPAYIERDAAGVIVAEEWWKGGERICAFFGN